MAIENYRDIALLLGFVVAATVLIILRSRQQKTPKMSNQRQSMEVFLDLRPTQPKNEQTREIFRRSLQQRFEQELSDSVERIWDLPPITVRLNGDYLALLQEARELYVTGYFYSCVAMCGIVAERIVKDALRASVLVQKKGSASIPSDQAFDQFERVEVNGIVRFLKEADILSADAARAAEDLSQLRNKYAHARGKASPDDAIKSVKLLHILVEDTVSVFKDLEIKNGVLVPKRGTSQG